MFTQSLCNSLFRVPSIGFSGSHKLSMNWLFRVLQVVQTVELVFQGSAWIVTFQFAFQGPFHWFFRIPQKLLTQLAFQVPMFTQLLFRVLCLRNLVRLKRRPKKDTNSFESRTAQAHAKNINYVNIMAVLRIWGRLSSELPRKVQRLSNSGAAVRLSHSEITLSSLCNSRSPLRLCPARLLVAALPIILLAARELGLSVAANSFV